jgi:hypothetical protein
MVIVTLNQLGRNLPPWPAPATRVQGDFAVEFTLDRRDGNVQVVDDPPGSRPRIKCKNPNRCSVPTGLRSVAVAGVSPGNMGRSIEKTFGLGRHRRNLICGRQRWTEKVAAGVADRFGRETQPLQDGGGNAFRDQARQEVMPPTHNEQVQQQSTAMSPLLSAVRRGSAALSAPQRH